VSIMPGCRQLIHFFRDAISVNTMRYSLLLPGSCAVRFPSFSEGRAFFEEMKTKGQVVIIEPSHQYRYFYAIVKGRSVGVIQGW
jgi:hypothetical protein